MRRSTRSSTPSSSAAPAPRAPSTPARVRLVDHQAGAVAGAQLDDVHQRRHVALHREDAVDDDQHAAAVVLGAAERALELVHAVVAEGAHLRPREQHAVEDRGVVAGVDDHRVAGVEQRAERAHVRLMAGGEDDRVLAAPSTPPARARAPDAAAWCRSAGASRSARCRSAPARRARPASRARRPVRPR